MNIANCAKHLQGKADKLAHLGLPALATSPSNKSAAYDAVDNMWMSTTKQMQQMQLPSSCLSAVFTINTFARTNLLVF